MSDPLSISNEVISYHSSPTESLNSSQVALSCSIQSFFAEATSFSALFSLAAGQGIASIVKSQGLRLFSPLCHSSAAQILSSSLSYISEGISFNIAAELGRSGEFHLGSFTDNLHGISTILVCKSMNRGLLINNLLVQHFAQNGALMTLDLTFEAAGLREKRNIALAERFLEAEITSFRMEVSAKFLATASPDIALFRATQELDYEGRKTKNTPQNNKTTFNPFQEIFSPALATTHGEKIINPHFFEESSPLHKRGAGLLMMINEEEADRTDPEIDLIAATRKFERLEDETISIPTQTTEQLADFVLGIGLNPDSKTGRLALQILSVRLSEGESPTLFTRDFGRFFKGEIDKISPPVHENDIKEELAILFTACAGAPVEREAKKSYWQPLFNEGTRLISGSEGESLQQSIELGNRYATKEYKTEIKKVQTAIARLNMLMTASRIPLVAENLNSIAPLFYRALALDVQRIALFNELFSDWQTTSEIIVFPVLGEVGEFCKQNRFWTEGLQESDLRRLEKMEIRVNYQPSPLDSNREKVLQESSILIQLKNDNGFQPTDFTLFLDRFSKRFGSFLGQLQLVQQGSVPPHFIAIHKNIRFSVHLLLKGKTLPSAVREEMNLSSESDGTRVIELPDTIMFNKVGEEEIHHDSLGSGETKAIELEKQEPNHSLATDVPQDPQRLSRIFNRTADYLWLGGSLLASPETAKGAITGWVISQLRIPVAFGALLSATVTHLAWSYHAGNSHPIANTALFAGVATLYGLWRGRMLIKESKGNPHPFKGIASQERPEIMPVDLSVIDASKVYLPLENTPEFNFVDRTIDPIDGFPQQFSWAIKPKALGFSLFTKLYYTIADPARASMSMAHLTQIPGSGVAFYPFARWKEISLKNCRPRNGGKIFSTFNAGFTRELIQPFTRGAAGYEGEVIYVGSGDRTQLVNLKGDITSLQDALGEDGARFFPPHENLIAIVTYLSPKNLHDAASPIQGKVVHVSEIPGKYYTVGTEIWNETNVEGEPGTSYLKFNRRFIIIIENEEGPRAFVFVAATNVGSANIHVKVGDEVDIGQHIQTYNLGSTNLEIALRRNYYIPSLMSPHYQLQKGKSPFLIPKRMIRLK